MKLNAILQQFETPFKSKYAGRILPSIYRAINALLCCKTTAAGQFKRKRLIKHVLALFG
jgi:hypothetical protein